jgi:hypothetical protein
MTKSECFIITATGTTIGVFCYILFSTLARPLCLNEHEGFRELVTECVKHSGDWYGCRNCAEHLGLAHWEECK